MNATHAHVRGDDVDSETERGANSNIASLGARTVVTAIALSGALTHKSITIIERRTTLPCPTWQSKVRAGMDGLAYARVLRWLTASGNGRPEAGI